jgi:AcrR family transcriptional regulator
MNSPGLRERKKQKTRWAIQEQALRLFAEQGYEATTVDQIAAAAEISPSTFFRYFPTKEDLVIQDQYDALLVSGLKAAPADLGPVAAIRLAASQALLGISAADEARIHDRSLLVFSVPSLRARSMDSFLGTIEVLRKAIGERVGRSPDELEVRAFAGAVVGALTSVMEMWLVEPAAGNLADLVDAALEKVEQGLPI